MSEEQVSPQTASQQIENEDGGVSGADSSRFGAVTPLPKSQSIFPMPQLVLLVVLAGMVLNMLLVKNDTTRTYVFVALLALWFLPRVFFRFLRPRNR